MSSEGPDSRRRKTGRPSLRSPEEASNRTIGVGLQLLQAMARMDAPATLTEIAQTAGMSVTRTSRYLMSLTLNHFLQLDRTTGEYDLGPAAIELGMAAMGRIDAVRLASDLIRTLTEKTGLVSILSVWGSNGPTVIKWEQGRLDLAIRIREGLNLSVVITAAGRIFLAYYDAAELQPILQRDLKSWNGSAPPAQRLTLKDVEVLKREILHHGLAEASGLRNIAMAAIAVPVFGRDKRLAMSLTLAGIVGSFDNSYAGKPARELKATAEKVSRMLGGLESGSSNARKIRV